MTTGQCTQENSLHSNHGKKEGARFAYSYVLKCVIKNKSQIIISITRLAGAVPQQLFRLTKN